MSDNIDESSKEGIPPLPGSADGSSKDGKEKEIEFLQRTAAKISAKNVDEIKGIEDQSKDNIDESSKEGIPPLPGSADGSSKDGKEKEIEFLQRTAAKISAKNVDEIKGIEDQSKDNIDESSKEGIPPLPGSADGSSKDEKEKEIEFLQRTAAEISAKNVDEIKGIEDQSKDIECAKNPLPEESANKSHQVAGNDDRDIHQELKQVELAKKHIEETTNVFSANASAVVFETDEKKIDEFHGVFSSSGSTSEGGKKKTAAFPEAKSEAASLESQQSDGSWLSSSPQQISNQRTKFQHSTASGSLLSVEPTQNSLSKSAGSSTAFRSSFEEAFDLAMSRIDISNPLKEPICLLASKVDSMGKQLNRKIDDLDTKMEKGFASISNRLDHFLGRNKDSISSIFESQCKKTMQKRLNREFQQNVKFECTFEGNYGDEELDLFSSDASKSPAYVLVECTIALIDKSKVKKCTRKRDFIAKQYGLTGSSIAAYIMCMRIDEDMKAELQELAKEDNIVIYINDDA